MNNHYVPADNRNIKTTENDADNFCEKVLIVLSYLVTVITFPFSMIVCLLTVAEFERTVIFRLGRLRKGARGPGLIFVLPCIDEYVKVDMRVNSFDVPPQEILTKDSVTITVDAVVYYYIKEPLKAVIQVADAREATQFLAQTTLRNVAGTKMLMELLTEKGSLSQSIGQILDEATDAWGIKVERVEIKEIQMPIEMQRAMAAEQEAERNAMAKIAAAQGELDSAGALKEASDVMKTNPIALQLRYLQTLNSVSTQNNRTIIFPFPVDLMKRLIAAAGKSNSDGKWPPWSMFANNDKNDKSKVNSNKPIDSKKNTNRSSVSKTNEKVNSDNLLTTKIQENMPKRQTFIFESAPKEEVMMVNTYTQANLSEMDFLSAKSVIIPDKEFHDLTSIITTTTTTTKTTTTNLTPIPIQCCNDTECCIDLRTII